MTNNKTSRVTKWKKIGVSSKDRDKIREKIRSQAKTILKNRHEEEYLKIIKKLQETEYKRLKKVAHI